MKADINIRPHPRRIFHTVRITLGRSSGRQPVRTALRLAHHIYFHSAVSDQLVTAVFRNFQYQRLFRAVVVARACVCAVMPRIQHHGQRAGSLQVRSGLERTVESVIQNILNLLFGGHVALSVQGNHTRIDFRLCSLRCRLIEYRYVRFHADFCIYTELHIKALTVKRQRSFFSVQHIRDPCQLIDAALAAVRKLQRKEKQILRLRVRCRLILLPACPVPVYKLYVRGNPPRLSKAGHNLLRAGRFHVIRARHYIIERKLSCFLCIFCIFQRLYIP